MKKYLLLALCLVSGSAFCLSASETLQNKLNAIKTMSANFTEKVVAGKRVVSESSGKMALSRPGRFRWETLDPLEQVVVADSEQLWVYDVDLEQVTVKKQDKGVGGTPALFLSGSNNNIDRDFSVVMQSNDVFKLKAKNPKENFQRVTLTFKGAEMSQIEFFDQLGQHTTVNLRNVKNNPSLAAKLFQFKPPKGVDVVRQ